MTDELHIINLEQEKLEKQMVKALKQLREEQKLNKVEIVGKED